MNDTFYDSNIKDLFYIDTGSGDEEHRDGQTVLAMKAKGKVIKPPVGDYYPSSLIDNKEDTKVYSCSQVDLHPQNFATNVFSATVTFLMVNNIISLNKVRNVHARFNSDDISIM